MRCWHNVEQLALAFDDIVISNESDLVLCHIYWVQTKWISVLSVMARSALLWDQRVMRRKIGIVRSIRIFMTTSLYQTIHQFRTIIFRNNLTYNPSALYMHHIKSYESVEPVLSGQFWISLFFLSLYVRVSWMAHVTEWAQPPTDPNITVNLLCRNRFKK